MTGKTAAPLSILKSDPSNYRKYEVMYGLIVPHMYRAPQHMCIVNPPINVKTPL